MMYLLGILVFIVGLVISVGLHECGHLIPAKAFGVKVSQFFIGFGSTVWSRPYKGTEYGIKALPLGGYVRISGMFPPGRPGRKTHKSNGELTFVEEQRRESLAEQGSGRGLWELTPARRIVVMLGGPVMNLVLAFVLMVLAQCVIGVPQASAQVAGVTACVEDVAAQESSSSSTESMNGAGSCTPSPARLAGLKPGDLITAIGNHKILDFSDVTSAVAQLGAGEHALMYIRGGREYTTNVTIVHLPPARRAEASSESGSGSTMQARPFLGVSSQLLTRKASVPEAMCATGALATGTMRALASIPSSLANATGALAGLHERDSTGVISVVGVAEAAGSIAGADSAGYLFSWRIADLLRLIAALNMSLFIFNLIPLLPLDGGHIACALADGVRRLAARLTHRAMPRPIDTAKLIPLSYGVFIALCAISLVLVVADILVPLT